MKTGDIFFHHGTSLRSKLIQYGTECKWSHCGFVYIDELTNEIFILELQQRKALQMPRVGLTPISFYEGQQWTTLPYPKELDVSKMLKHCGTLPYDIASLAFFQVYRQISKKFFNKDIWLGKVGEGAYKRATCSEFVGHEINAQYPEYCKFWAWASPADIYFSLLELYKELNYDTSNINLK